MQQFLEQHLLSNNTKQGRNIAVWKEMFVVLWHMYVQPAVCGDAAARPYPGNKSL